MEDACVCRDKMGSSENIVQTVSRKKAYNSKWVLCGSFNNNEHWPVTDTNSICVASGIIKWHQDIFKQKPDHVYERAYQIHKVKAIIFGTKFIVIL